MDNQLAQVASKGSIVIDTPQGKVSSTGFVTYGIILVLILFIIGKYFIHPKITKRRTK